MDKKIKVDFLFQGKHAKGKLSTALEICKHLGISINDVAYIGDDINCLDLLRSCGLKACPSNAVNQIKQIPNIINLNKSGGEGAIREFLNYIDFD